MILEKHDPLDLERIKLVTIIKVIEFNWWSHSAGDPYIQISIDCLAVDGMAGVVHANIQESGKYGDFRKVAELATRYSLGSLHWITCRAFCFMEEGLHFFNAKTKAVNAEDAEKIDSFYFGKSHTDCEPKKKVKPMVIATSDISKDMDCHTVILSGLIEHLRTTHTKSGRRMAYASLNDNNGTIDLIIFPNVYDAYENALLKKNSVDVTGRLDVSESTLFLIAESFELSER